MIATEPFFSCTAMIHSSNSHSVFWRDFFSSLRFLFFSFTFFFFSSSKIWKNPNWHLFLGNGYSKDLGGTLKRWRNVMSGDKHEVKWHYGMLLMVLAGGRRIYEVCACDITTVCVYLEESHGKTWQFFFSHSIISHISQFYLPMLRKNSSFETD